jgi:hypothetical protein
VYLNDESKIHFIFPLPKSPYTEFSGRARKLSKSLCDEHALEFFYGVESGSFSNNRLPAKANQRHEQKAPEKKQQNLSEVRASCAAVEGAFVCLCEQLADLIVRLERQCRAMAEASTSLGRKLHAEYSPRALDAAIELLLARRAMAFGGLPAGAFPHTWTRSRSLRGGGAIASLER